MYEIVDISGVYETGGILHVMRNNDEIVICAGDVYG